MFDTHGFLCWPREAHEIPTCLPLTRPACPPRVSPTTEASARGRTVISRTSVADSSISNEANTASREDKRKEAAFCPSKASRYVHGVVHMGCLVVQVQWRSALGQSDSHATAWSGVGKGPKQPSLQQVAFCKTTKNGSYCLTAIRSLVWTPRLLSISIHIDRYCSSQRGPRLNMWFSDINVVAGFRQRLIS